MITDPIELNPTTEPGHFSTAKVAQCTRQEVCLVLKDEKNRILDLGSDDIVKNTVCNDCDDDDDGTNINDNPGFSDGIKPKSDWPDTKIKLVASPGYGHDQLFEVQGTVINESEARVVFHLTEDQTTRPGMFLAEVGLFRGSLLLQRWPFYLVIEKSLFSTTQSQYAARGIPSIAEVRLAIRDLVPGDQDLLDEVEFKEAEIMQDIRRPVDEWNEMLPFESSLEYTYEEFPFREHWIRATTAHLLETAAHWYRRNKMPVVAGGVQHNSRAKDRDYEQKAQQLLREWRDWATNAKSSLSLRMAFGTFGSTFPYQPAKKGYY